MARILVINYESEDERQSEGWKKIEILVHNKQACVVAC